MSNKRFSDFHLPSLLNDALADMQYTNPTEVQAATIPLAMEGHDIIGSAQTGTGKTAAFSIPLVAKLIDGVFTKERSALILTPTRELAMQVVGVIKQLLNKQPNIKTALLIGGDNMAKQFKQLRAKPKIIVGTPGRVNDHLNRDKSLLNNVCFLVLDETDRMLDMGFGKQLDMMLPSIPKERQTLLFSATLPDSIIRVSKKYLTNPQRIAIGAVDRAIDNIKQEFVPVKQEDKYTRLLEELRTRSGHIIVFVRTKIDAEKLAKKLYADGKSVAAIHGDLKQGKRKRILSEFRNKDFLILIATDVASRGLDILHIEHVINYDLPQLPEDYIHRVGRTARAGGEGAAISFIAARDAKLWRDMQKLLGIKSEIKFNSDKEGKASSKRRGGGRSDNKRKIEHRSENRNRNNEYGGQNKFNDRRITDRSDNKRTDRSDDRRGAGQFKRDHNRDNNNNRRVDEGKFVKKPRLLGLKTENRTENMLLEANEAPRARYAKGKTQYSNKDGGYNTRHKSRDDNEQRRNKQDRKQRDHNYDRRDSNKMSSVFFDRSEGGNRGKHRDDSKWKKSDGNNNKYNKSKRDFGSDGTKLKREDRPFFNNEGYSSDSNRYKGKGDARKGFGRKKSGNKSNGSSFGGNRFGNKKSSPNSFGKRNNNNRRVAK